MSSDLAFAAQFARMAGRRMVSMRGEVGAKVGADINAAFIGAVRKYSNERDAVVGEGRSDRRTSPRVWAICPLSGRGEYGKPSVPNAERVSCIGITLLVRGVLTQAVVFNPFRNMLFSAEGGGGRTLLNGTPVYCSSVRAGRGAPYDFAHWGSQPRSLPALTERFGKPQGVGSAIWQACMVAMGQSTFAAFAGNAIYDIAPGALLVMRAGGVVTDFRGRPVDWGKPRLGVLYANRHSHDEALKALRTS